MANDEQVAASSFQVGLDGNKPVEIDLCEEHEKEFLLPLRELLGDVGQPVNRTPSVTGGGGPKKACTQPSCDKALTREGMRKHMVSQHQMDRRAAGDTVREVFGSIRPGNVGTYVCPECKTEFDTPQGRGVHRRTVHGIKGPQNLTD